MLFKQILSYPPRRTWDIIFLGEYVIVVLFTQREYTFLWDFILNRKVLGTPLRTFLIMLLFTHAKLRCFHNPAHNFSILGLQLSSHSSLA
jgi:hypothetical protein